MALALAEGLGVSYKWLSDGIEDNSFVLTLELNVFTNIYMLLAFLSTKELSDKNEKKQLLIIEPFRRMISFSVIIIFFIFVLEIKRLNLLNILNYCLKKIYIS